MLKKQIRCPKCNADCRSRIRYAYSSWFFPVPCPCGARYFLGYSALAFLLIWFFLSPFYLVSLLFLTIFLVPDSAVLPVFAALGAASMVLLVYLGKPTLK